MYPIGLDQFATCYRAYASALLAVQNPDDDTCLAIALRIIEASASGECDAARLEQYGLDGSMLLHEIG